MQKDTGSGYSNERCVSAGRGGLLRVLRPHAVDTCGNPFHLVFTEELHFLELDFFEEVFGTEVGSPGDSLQFAIVFPVLL
jgi:hypothetical protein